MLSSAYAASVSRPSASTRKYFTDRPRPVFPGSNAARYATNACADDRAIFPRPFSRASVVARRSSRVDVARASRIARWAGRAKHPRVRATPRDANSQTDARAVLTAERDVAREATPRARGDGARGERRARRARRRGRARDDATREEGRGARTREVNRRVDSRERAGTRGREGSRERARRGRRGAGKTARARASVARGRVEDGIGTIWDGRRLRLSASSTSVTGR